MTSEEAIKYINNYEKVTDLLGNSGNKAEQLKEFGVGEEEIQNTANLLNEIFSDFKDDSQSIKVEEVTAMIERQFNANYSYILNDQYLVFGIIALMKQLTELGYEARSALIDAYRYTQTGLDMRILDKVVKSLNEIIEGDGSDIVKSDALLILSSITPNDLDSDIHSNIANIFTRALAGNQSEAIKKDVIMYGTLWAETTLDQGREADKYGMPFDGPSM